MTKTKIICYFLLISSRALCNNLYSQSNFNVVNSSIISISSAATTSFNDENSIRLNLRNGDSITGFVADSNKDYVCMSFFDFNKLLAKSSVRTYVLTNQSSIAGKLVKIDRDKITIEDKNNTLHEVKKTAIRHVKHRNGSSLLTTLDIRKSAIQTYEIFH